MALSFEDRLLGEKAQNYCSSSEDEDERDDEPRHSGSRAAATTLDSHSPPPTVSPPEIGPTDGHSTHTGPKGVLEDYRRFCELETERHEQLEHEQVDLARRLCLATRTVREDQSAQKAEAATLQAISDTARDADEEAEFLAEYRRRRMEEMRRSLEASATRFDGLGVVELTAANFLQHVDPPNVPANATVVLHVFEAREPACRRLNRCLEELARLWPTVKWCIMSATEARVSARFARHGVPALLIYRGGQLVGSHVSLSENELGSVDKFGAEDVETFLQECGHLPPDRPPSKPAVYGSSTSASASAAHH